MTGDGESIWSMGERAKKFEKLSATHAEAIEAKDREIAELKEKVSTLTVELDASRGRPQRRPIGKAIG
jgi:hypothetical protein